MIIDGLLAAEPHLAIAQRVYDPKRYLYLTDDIMPQIEASTSPVSIIPLPIMVADIHPSRSLRLHVRYSSVSAHATFTVAWTTML